MGDEALNERRRAIRRAIFASEEERAASWGDLASQIAAQERKAQAMRDAQAIRYDTEDARFLEAVECRLQDMRRALEVA